MKACERCVYGSGVHDAGCPLAEKPRKPREKPKKKVEKENFGQAELVAWAQWAQKRIELLTAAVDAIPGRLERQRDADDRAHREAMKSLNGWASRFDQNWNKEIVVLRNQLGEMDARWNAVKAAADVVENDVKALHGMDRSINERLDELTQRFNSKWWK